MNQKNLFGLAWVSVHAHTFLFCFTLFIFKKSITLYRYIQLCVTCKQITVSGKEQRREDASPFPSHYKPQNTHAKLCHMCCMAKLSYSELQQWIVRSYENRQVQRHKNMIEKYFQVIVYGNLISDPPNEEQKERRVAPRHLRTVPS